MNKLEIARQVREIDHDVDVMEAALWELLKHCMEDEGVISDVISIMLRTGTDNQIPAHWVKMKKDIIEIIDIYSDKEENVSDIYSGDLFIYTFLHVYDESYHNDRWMICELCDRLNIDAEGE